MRRHSSSDKHRKFNVSRFSRKEAAQLVDTIDRGILQKETFPNNLKSAAFGVLRRISGKFRKLPQSYLIEEGLSKEGKLPLPTRGFSTLWKGRLNDNPVAIKMLRLGPEDDKIKIAARFCKEVLLWPRLRHPNVLPVSGFSLSTFPFGIISLWMENGNVLEYTRKHPGVNRMNLLVDVANGLRYLHKVDQVHGNIRGANVLISNDNPPRACLTDFGLNVIMFDAFSMSKASINWTAPEIFVPGERDFKPTYASDIYALGMLIYEVLTGRSPFYHKRTKAELAYQVVQEHKRPLQPQDSERLGITDSVWNTMVTCWDEKVSARLQIESIIKCLTQAAKAWVADVPTFLLASEVGVTQVMDFKGDDAQNFVDNCYKTLVSTEINSPSGKTYLTRLKALCEVSGTLPTLLTLSGEFGDLGTKPVNASGSANIHKANYEGREVSVKTLKVRSKQPLDSAHKRLVKEVIGWARLRHENILPFIGVSTHPTRFSMVSEWMPHGDIMSFIAHNNNRNLFPLLIDVVVGLQYLHRNDFVHGNLKGANILIDSSFRARLADFARTRVIDEGALESQTKPPTGLERDEKIGEVGESIRWSAPEIIDPDKFGFTKNSFSKLPSKSTDIYALAMTILEVLTGRPPFGRSSDGRVVRKVMDGVRPERPNSGFSDELWNLLQLSWSEKHENRESPRPSITLILEQLQTDSSSWFSTPRLAFPSVESKQLSFRNNNPSTKAVETIPGDPGLRDLLMDIENGLLTLTV